MPGVRMCVQRLWKSELLIKLLKDYKSHLCLVIARFLCVLVGRCSVRLYLDMALIVHDTPLNLYIVLIGEHDMYYTC